MIQLFDFIRLYKENDDNQDWQVIQYFTTSDCLALITQLFDAGNTKAAEQWVKGKHSNKIDKEKRDNSLFSILNQWEGEGS